MVNRSNNEPGTQTLQGPEDRGSENDHIYSDGLIGSFRGDKRKPKKAVEHKPISVEATSGSKNRFLKNLSRVAMVGIPLAIFAPIGFNLMNQGETPNTDKDPVVTDPVVSNPDRLPDPIEPSAEPTVSTPEQTTSPSNLDIPFDSGEAVVGENEFDISNEKYAELVDRYRINLPADAKPEQVLAVATDIIEEYYASGHSLKDREEHYLYGSTGGWNSWATAVNTDALVNGLFVDGYDEENSNSNIVNLATWKTEANRIWINTVKAGETPYKIDVNFTPEAIQATANSFTATGMYVLSSNATESPTAASDSKSFVTPDQAPTMKFVMGYNNTGTNPGWKVVQMNTTQ